MRPYLYVLHIRHLLLPIQVTAFVTWLCHWFSLSALFIRYIGQIYPHSFFHDTRGLYKIIQNPNVYLQIVRVLQGTSSNSRYWSCTLMGVSEFNKHFPYKSRKKDLFQFTGIVHSIICYSDWKHQFRYFDLKIIVFDQMNNEIEYNSRTSNCQSV